jgi:putative transposase
MTKPVSPFRYFNSSPGVIRPVVMMYVRYPLSLRNVEDLLHERSIDISYETVRYWWNRFGPMFAAEIRKKRVDYMRGQRHWKWPLDETYVKINGEMHYWHHRASWARARPLPALRRSTGGHSTVLG